MLCVVVLEVEDGDFRDLKGSALDVHSSCHVVEVSSLFLFFPSALRASFGKLRFPKTTRNGTTENNYRIGFKSSEPSQVYIHASQTRSF